MNIIKGIAIWSITFVVLLAAVAGAVHENLANDAKVITHVPTTHKVVALTFDDGPHPGTTPELLKVLQEKGVKATFFILGCNAEEHKELFRRVAAAGHELANHGYSHRFAKDVPQAEFLADIDRAEAVLAAAGVKSIYFRPPGGSYNNELLAKIQRKGYTTVLWSVDTRDWTRPAVSQVYKTAVENIKPGNIYLFHDGQDKLPTPKAVGMLIDTLRVEGYQIVTLSELLQYYEIRH